jgi:nucleotide-binding universal stress UspA family protein
MDNISSITDHPFTIVVALDLADTPSGGFAFEQAGRIALRIAGSQVHVLHVSAKDPTDQTLGLLRMYVSERLKTIEGASGLPVAAHVRQGDAPTVIAQFAADIWADLVVVGTHKPAHLKSLFVGSTAERLMAKATCPVLVAGPKPKPAENHLIVIEAPCADCVRVRLDSRGRTWWCARHAERHDVLRHHHLYHYEGPGFEEHDSEVSATGVDVE